MLLRTLLSVAVVAFVLGICAGRWDWVRGWATVALYGLAQLGTIRAVERAQPGLMARRTRMGTGTRTWDRVLVTAYLLAVYAVFVVGALAVRHHGEDLPAWTWPVGATLYLVGIGIGIRAMAANRHFESTVRLQADHAVVDRGPYAVVRHPGYAGGLLALPGFPLLLGASAAYVPALVVLVLALARTATEDRFLRGHLPGYADYAARVRWRLVPGVW